MIDQIRKHMKLVESAMDHHDPDEMKFWFNPKTGEFITHDIDTHHVKVAAQDYQRLGLEYDRIKSNPYVDGSPNYFGDPDEDEDAWTEEDADNDDRVTKHAIEQGWVRGGHIIDLMDYHERGQIRHEGGIYLQGSKEGCRRAVAAIMRRWPAIEYVEIDFGERRHITLDAMAMEDFARKGIIPS
jgi:hypothetical protein